MHVWALYVWVCMCMHLATDPLPGAFAKAVIITTEAVGTPPTNANKGVQALHFF